MPLLIPLIVLAMVGALFVAISRGNELFLLSVREGHVLLVRGRIPPAVMTDLKDVIARAKIQRGSMRAVRSAGHSRLVVRGIDEPTSQRLRNAFGVHPIQRLQSAPAPRDRNLGQLLGVTALAWFFSRNR